MNQPLSIEPPKTHLVYWAMQLLSKRPSSLQFRDQINRFSNRINWFPRLVPFPGFEARFKFEYLLISFTLGEFRLLEQFHVSFLCLNFSMLELAVTPYLYSFHFCFQCWVFTWKELINVSQHSECLYHRDKKSLDKLKTLGWCQAGTF